MKKLQYFLLIIFFALILQSLFSFILIGNVNAQGTFDCGWDGSECVVFDNNCEQNLPSDCYDPEPLVCQGYDQIICPSIRDQECVSVTCPVDPPPPDEGEPGKFACVWNGAGCVVGINNCNFGYHARASLCPKNPTKSADCQNAGLIGCLSGESPQLYRFDTVAETCTETDAPENAYDDKAQCIKDYNKLYSGGGGDAPALCGPDDNPGIDTAIGCIPVYTSEAFIGFLLPWGIGIAGGVAFLLIIYASFMIMTSAGNPKRIQAGKELLTAAIAGLILLIFSVFLLQIIGVDILNLPEFGN